MTVRITVIDHIKRYGDDKYFEPEPCESPTKETPGTAARVDEYARRVEAGVELHHADDERFEHALPLAGFNTWLMHIRSPEYRMRR